MTSSADRFLSVGPIDAYPSTRLAAKELENIFPDRVDTVHMPRKTKIGVTLRKDSSVRAHTSKEAGAR